MNQFILPAGFGAQQVVELLESETAVATSAIQAVITESPTSEQVSIYDTFDWRLYNQNFALFSVGSQFTLRDLVEGKTAVQLELARIIPRQTGAHPVDACPLAYGKRKPPENHSSPPQ